MIDSTTKRSEKLSSTKQNCKVIQKIGKYDRITYPNEVLCLAMDNYFTLPIVVTSLQEKNIRMWKLLGLERIGLMDIFEISKKIERIFQKNLLLC